jgi:mono/diheme cytochrome c family protein
MRAGMIHVAAVLALAAGMVSAADDPARMAGEMMYRAGILPSGQPMTGLSSADVPRRGQDAACGACHRRSGFGMAEGAFVVPPIAGADLYQTRTVVAATPRIAHQLGQPLRPAYDDESLAKAIRSGVDVMGRPMTSLMPRYALDDAEMEALLSYLKSLSSASPPGITEEELHLATVIQPDVTPARRRAMMEVFETFLRDKNAGPRSEEHRRSAGTMRMHRAYRKWVLHTWELDGPEEGWQAQLEARYRQQPVFALMGGIGTRSWQPIHAFSERFQVPCILPLTNLPALEESNFYTIYFSRGISLEAEGLAKHLGDRRAAGKVVQVYRAGDAGAVAAAAFRSALPNVAARLEDRPLHGAAAEDFWRSIAGAKPTAVVLWLNPQDLAGIERLAGNPDVAQTGVYLSASLLDGADAPRGEQVRLTYPWELPAIRLPLVQRAKYWLRSRGVAPLEEEVQINAYFVITTVGEALAHMMDSFSREYFVERVEHGITTTLMTSVYPRLSLGPDQRFASKGIYIVRPGASQKLHEASDLIVP